MNKPSEQLLIKMDEEQAGGRLDAVISGMIEEISRSYLARLVEDGQVSVNGTVQIQKKYKVKTGDLIRVTLPEVEPLDVAAENIPIDIVYEDADVLVVNKEKGMVVHPAAGNYTGTLVNAVLFHCKDLSSINGIIRPGIVHRIDKDTSGLLMIAKNDLAHASLAAQLKDHSITRAYHAVVLHNLKEDQGTIRAMIGRDPANRLKMAVTDKNSKDAVTHYRVLERFGQFTYLEARLETGRTHQIRVHMAHINHPLLGDQIYGPKKAFLGVQSQMLHARQLGFLHPTTGEYMEFEAPLPSDFAKILQRLRQQ